MKTAEFNAAMEELDGYNFIRIDKSSKGSLSASYVALQFDVQELIAAIDNLNEIAQA